MSFLLGIPSLKRMASVQVCGNLLRNERPIRELIDIDSTVFPQTWDEEERLASMRLELMKNLSLINLPRSLEQELQPLIQHMAKNFVHFFKEFGSLFDDEIQRFLFKFLSQVRFRNRGDVDTFATTRRHLQEDGAMRDENPGEVFMWACTIGDPVVIKTELSRNRNRICQSLNKYADADEMFWLPYLDENFLELQRLGTIPIATTLMILEEVVSYGF